MDKLYLFLLNDLIFKKVEIKAAKFDATKASN